MLNLSLKIDSDFGTGSLAGCQWEDLVKASQEAGFMQSLHWAEFKRRQGLQCFHLKVMQDQSLLGGALLYAPQKQNGKSILVAPEGPVLDWQDEQLAEEVLQQLIKSCKELSKEAGTMALRIEPRLKEPAPAFLLAEFGRAPADLIPKETLYLDLSKNEEALLAGMKAKGRYNIALAQRRGVSIVEASDLNAIRRFYGIMREVSQRDHFALEPLSYFELMHESLPHPMLRLFFAEHEGQLLGTLLLITYGKRATYLYGGITNKKRNLMAGYALQWHAIKMARQAGCIIYDFFGYDQFLAPRSAYARFSQFKSKFGGTPIRFAGARDRYFADQLADTIIAALNEISPGLQDKSKPLLLV